MLAIGITAAIANAAVAASRAPSPRLPRTRLPATLPVASAPSAANGQSSTITGVMNPLRSPEMFSTIASMPAAQPASSPARLLRALIAATDPAASSSTPVAPSSRPITAASAGTCSVRSVQGPKANRCPANRSAVTTPMRSRTELARLSR
jgi:hypothetical protein